MISKARFFRKDFARRRAFNETTAEVRSQRVELLYAAQIAEQRCVLKNTYRNVTFLKGGIHEPRSFPITVARDRKLLQITARPLYPTKSKLALKAD